LPPQKGLLLLLEAQSQGLPGLPTLPPLPWTWLSVLPSLGQRVSFQHLHGSEAASWKPPLISAWR
jgi:hypothetical protein